MRRKSEKRKERRRGGCEASQMDQKERALLILDKEAAIVPNGLREAVEDTLEVSRVMSSIRTRCLKFKEEGLLHDVVEAWYVEKYVPSLCLTDYFDKDVEARNPYAKFKLDHPGHKRLFKQLDFLLEETPVYKDHLRFDLGLSNSDFELLTRDLNSEGKLACIICPSRYLTHEENVAVALLDARLWLNRSPLPVVLGVDGTGVSYADVRNGAAHPPPCNQGTLPSTFHLDLKESEVGAFYSLQLNPKARLHQLHVADFPEHERHRYWVRLARVRYPHVDLQAASSKDWAAFLLSSAVDEEEARVEALEDWKESESGPMGDILAHLIWDCRLISEGSCS